MNEYFTLASLVSFSGALFFALLVPNVILSLAGEEFRPYARMTALAVALGITVLGAIFSDGDWTKFVVAVFNGLVVYGAAYGINAQVVERQDAQAPVNVRSIAYMSQKKRFFQKW